MVNYSSLTIYLKLRKIV